MTATVVLVHGAWHGSWCWARVEALLEARGIRTVAIDLPRQRMDPLRPDLGADQRGRALVSAVLDSCAEGAVLVGHSMGGRVLTTLGDHANVRRLVYLAAVMPPADVDAATFEASLASPPSLLADSVVIGADGAITVHPDATRELFYADCSDGDVEWATSQLVPEWLSAPQAIQTRAPWMRVPSTYVVCEADRALRPDLQETMAEQATDVVRLSTSHSPFLSAPEVLADIIAVHG